MGSRNRGALRPRRLGAAVTAIVMAALLTAWLGDGVATAARKPPTTSGSSGPTAATGSPTKPCGSRTFKKADGSSYRCSWSDEFSGSALDPNKWTTVLTAVNGQRTGYECLLDDPNAVSVGSNALNLTVRRLDTPMTCASPYGDFTTSYIGGMITTASKFSQAYGRFEIRARFLKATVAGLQSALWLYPQTMTYGAWPASGEIDIAEWFSGWGDRVIPHLHYTGDTADPFATNRSCLVTDTSVFHTYALEWSPTSIAFIYDGTVCLRDVNWQPVGLVAPAPFDQPFAVLLAQGIGAGTNAPTTGTPFPATTQVDYVRVWS
jgi:beta-glucanase (GH16 family)